MKSLSIPLLSLLLALLSPTLANAQKICEVTGRYVYTVSDNDDITLREAKRKCIELAKAEAIKEKFGEMVTSDVIDSRSTASGEEAKAYYWENTVAMARGDWVADTKAPALQLSCTDNVLVITAEVWGKAREIIQSKADLKWDVLKDKQGAFVRSQQFVSGDRLGLLFRAPADGYLAVYLIVGDDDTSCLLPYPKDSDGKFPIKGGKDYILFDKDADSAAFHYRLKTDRQQEDNQIVLIYSPNPFTKCNETSGDSRHPGSLSTHDFQKWLLRCQRRDPDMVVDKKWVKIDAPARPQ